MPQLTIQVERRVDRITVEYDRDERDAAYDLLFRALPAIKDLDRRVRVNTSRNLREETRGEGD